MTLLARLAAYRPFTALVVGDFMLDQHVYGAAERLSPDAPVPVLHATKFEDRPGGSANVSLCLRALKANVHCVGVVGDDREGTSLRDELAKAGCDVDGILADASRPTTVKRSLIGLAQHRHPQKMFRLDFESRVPLDPEMVQQLLDTVRARIADADVVCLEDYNKGVCCEALCRGLIEICRAAHKPLLVDPAAIESYAKYRGATAITPNRSEAELATGMETPLDASEMHNAGLAKRLLNELDLDAVVLTLDRHGALLEVRDGSEGRVPNTGCGDMAARSSEPGTRNSILVPTVARSVYDVTGAGDMVLAALAGAIANGFDWLEAVQFANAAAGLEVEVFGVQPIPFVAVQREILRQSHSLDGKVRDMGALLVELAVHREAGRRIVFTNGCFDVIHAGHVAYLREAKSLGDVLVVAVNDDAGVRRLKGPGRPIYKQSERLEILSELQCIDYLIAFSEPTVETLLRAIVPDVYVKGGDYKPEEIAEHDIAAELGVELRVLAHRPGLASTRVIERMGAKPQAAGGDLH
jgi:D-beta-D-heptose 7-phosphate kinase / D-beta-D-heptose 1-phosphate adenosyltransferase